MTGPRGYSPTRPDLDKAGTKRLVMALIPALAYVNEQAQEQTRREAQS